MKRTIIRLFGYIFSSYLIIFAWLNHTKVIGFNSPWITFIEGVIAVMLLGIGLKILESSIEDIPGLEFLGEYLFFMGMIFVITSVVYIILAIVGVAAKPDNGILAILLFLFYLILGIILIFYGIVKEQNAYEEQLEEEDSHSYE